jgi:hypothetical protein
METEANPGAERAASGAARLGPGARAVRIGLGASFVLWLAWSAALGATRMLRDLAKSPVVWREAFELSLEERRTRTLDERDRLDGRPRGYVNQILAAVLEHVPPRATLYLSGLRDAKQAQDLVPIPHLAYPRRVRPAPSPMPSVWDGYLLSFDPALDGRLAQQKTRLASGPDWSLWH